MVVDLGEANLRIRLSLSELNSQPTGGKPFALVEGLSSKANQLLKVRHMNHPIYQPVDVMFLLLCVGIPTNVLALPHQ